MSKAPDLRQSARGPRDFTPSSVIIAEHNRGAYPPLEATLDQTVHSPLLPPSTPSHPHYQPLILSHDHTPHPSPSYLSPSTLALLQTNLGLIYVAVAQIFFVLMALTAKYFLTTTSISTFTLILVRMVITALCSLAWLSISGNPNPFLGPPTPGVRRLLCLRGIFGFGGLFSAYQSLRGLSVSDSATIQYLAPNLTAVLAWYMLGETLAWREIVAGLACLFGVGVVSRPPAFLGGGGSDALDSTSAGSASRITEGRAGMGMGQNGATSDSRIVGVLWALAAVVFASCTYTTIRKIGNQAHPLHLMLYFCYLGIMVCPIAILSDMDSFVFVETWTQFGLIILIGVFRFTGQILVTLGIRREKAGRASLAMYLYLAFSLVLELALFGTVPPLSSLLGGAIIIVSAVWVALTKKPEISDGYQKVGEDAELGQGVGAESCPASTCVSERGR